MSKKLTISIGDQVYHALHLVVGRGHIGKFLEALARPLVGSESLSKGYAEMTADRARETEADDWCESPQRRAR